MCFIRGISQRGEIHTYQGLGFYIQRGNSLEAVMSQTSSRKKIAGRLLHRPLSVPEKYWAVNRGMSYDNFHNSHSRVLLIVLEIYELGAISRLYYSAKCGNRLRRFCDDYGKY